MLYLDRFYLPVGPEFSMTLQIEPICRFWNGVEVPIGKSGATIEDLKTWQIPPGCAVGEDFPRETVHGVTESDTTERLNIAQHKHK